MVEVDLKVLHAHAEAAHGAGMLTGEQLADHAVRNSLGLGANLGELANREGLARACLPIREERPIVALADGLDEWLPNQLHERRVILTLEDVAERKGLWLGLATDSSPRTRVIRSYGDRVQGLVDLHTLAALAAPFAQRTHAHAHAYAVLLCRAPRLLQIRCKAAGALLVREPAPAREAAEVALDERRSLGIGDGDASETLIERRVAGAGDEVGRGRDDTKVG